MAKIQLSDQAIPGIPQDEKILIEGMMQTMRLYGNRSKYTFKYAVTDKGIWTLNRKTLFIKQRTVFLPYEDLHSYRSVKYGLKNSCIFYPKNGKAGNRIFFDKYEDVIKILDKYLTQLKEN